MQDYHGNTVCSDFPLSYPSTVHLNNTPLYCYHRHRGFCQKLPYRTLKEFMTHWIHRHFLESVSNISPSLLHTFFALTITNSPSLQWAPVVPILLFPAHGNKNLPELYSNDMYFLLRSAYTMTNPFCLHMRPSNYFLTIKGPY
jgi:hypothetical protein